MTDPTPALEAMGNHLLVLAERLAAQTPAGQMPDENSPAYKELVAEMTKAKDSLEKMQKDLEAEATAEFQKLEDQIKAEQMKIDADLAAAQMPKVPKVPHDSPGTVTRDFEQQHSPDVADAENLVARLLMRASRPSPNGL